MFAHEISSPAVVEWVHNRGNEATAVVLAGEVSVCVGLVSVMGDELETVAILVKAVVAYDELGLTVVMSLLVMVGVELLDMTSTVPDEPVEKEIKCFCKAFCKDSFLETVMSDGANSEN